MYPTVILALAGLVALPVPSLALSDSCLSTLDVISANSQTCPSYDKAGNAYQGGEYSLDFGQALEVTCTYGSQYCYYNTDNDPDLDDGSQSFPAASGNPTHCPSGPLTGTYIRTAAPQPSAGTGQTPVTSVDYYQCPEYTLTNAGVEIPLASVRFDQVFYYGYSGLVCGYNDGTNDNVQANCYYDLTGANTGNGNTAGGATCPAALCPAPYPLTRRADYGHPSYKRNQLDPQVLRRRNEGGELRKWRQEA